MSDKVRMLDKIYESMKVELTESTVNNLIISDERKYIRYAPSYQRNYIWTLEKATNLIETVLMNGIIPPLIVIKKGNRIDIMKDWEGRIYKDLAPNLRTLFKEYKVKMITYTVESSIDVSDEEVEYVSRDLFRRYKGYKFSNKSIKKMPRYTR